MTRGNYLIDQDFTIQDGNIILSDVKRSVRCKKCKKIVAMDNGSAMLIKGVTLFKTDQKTMMIKCDRCKTYNVIATNAEKS